MPGSGAPSPSRPRSLRYPRAFHRLDRQPASAGLFLDFDGTLAEIVLDPATAAPLPGLAELVDRLAGRLGRVAVLSGRPVAFLEPHFPDSVDLSGLYGLERREGGSRIEHPQAGSWREVVADVASVSAARGPEGMRVESKGMSLTLHYREHPELAAAVLAWAEQQAVRSGLEVRGARMSVELHPPIEADKGTALRTLAEGLGAVCYIGDDVGDLPAFDALDALAETGVETVRVAVDNAESGEQLTARADVVVDSPEGVAVLLAKLARRLETT